MIRYDQYYEWIVVWEEILLGHARGDFQVYDLASTNVEFAIKSIFTKFEEMDRMGYPEARHIASKISFVLVGDHKRVYSTLQVTSRALIAQLRLCMEGKQLLCVDVTYSWYVLELFLPCSKAWQSASVEHTSKTYGLDVHWNMGMPHYLRLVDICFIISA